MHSLVSTGLDYANNRYCILFNVQLPKGRCLTYTWHKDIHMLPLHTQQSILALAENPNTYNLRIPVFKPDNILLSGTCNSAGKALELMGTYSAKRKIHRNKTVRNIMGALLFSQWREQHRMTVLDVTLIDDGDLVIHARDYEKRPLIVVIKSEEMRNEVVLEVTYNSFLRYYISIKYVDKECDLFCNYNTSYIEGRVLQLKGRLLDLVFRSSVNELLDAFNLGNMNIVVKAQCISK